MDLERAKRQEAREREEAAKAQEKRKRDEEKAAAQERERQEREAQLKAEQARRQTEKERAQEQRSRHEGMGSKKPASGQRFDPYDVLQLPRGASKEEIRAAYRKLIKQYHPDKVSHLGKEFQDIAEQKAQAINRAYEILISG